MRKILLYPGDDQLLGSLKMRLKAQGFGEIVVPASWEGVFAEAAECLPEVAILENSSAPGDSYAMAKKLRERLGIPVILIVEGFAPDTVPNCEACGVAVVLSKPLREEDLVAAITLSVAAKRRIEALKAEVAALKEGIETRKVVEKAKGMLMERDGLSEAQAFRKMQSLSMDRRVSMRHLAEAMLLTDTISPQKRAALRGR